MMIVERFKTKKILFIGINVATLLFALSYTILYRMGVLALHYSETVAPLEESGIYVFLVFGKIFFIVAFCIVIWLDVIFLCDAIGRYVEDRNIGWL